LAKQEGNRKKEFMNISMPFTTIIQPLLENISTFVRHHSEMKVQVTEKVTPNHHQYRLERKDFWIKKMNSKTPNGLIKND
jgi:hypothetical protein